MKKVTIIDIISFGTVIVTVDAKKDVRTERELRKVYAGPTTYLDLNKIGTFEGLRDTVVKNTQNTVIIDRRDTKTNTVTDETITRLRKTGYVFGEIRRNGILFHNIGDVNRTYGVSHLLTLKRQLVRS